MYIHGFLVFPAQSVLLCEFRDPSLKWWAAGSRGIHTAEPHPPNLVAKLGRDSPWLPEISINRDGHLCSVNWSSQIRSWSKFVPGGAPLFLQLSREGGETSVKPRHQSVVFRDTLDEHSRTVIAPQCYIAAKHMAPYAFNRATHARSGRSCPLEGKWSAKPICTRIWVASPGLLRSACSQSSPNISPKPANLR